MPKPPLVRNAIPVTARRLAGGAAWSQMFASLRRHRNYRLYVGGQLVSQLGTWLQNAAQAWLVLDLTHSAAAVGFLGFCLYAPFALLGLVGGALADRWDRRRALLSTQIALAVCAAALAVTTWTHAGGVAAVDAIAALRGAIMALNNPSRQALMVELVGRAELPNAIALNSSVNSVTRVAGPAIAGVLIATIGIAPCFALNAVSFVPVVVAIVAMRPSEFAGDVRRERTPLVRAIADGLRYARRTKTVAIALAMLGTVSMLAINFSIVLPVLARTTLHGGAEIYGAIAATFGAGALAGSLATAARRRPSPELLLGAAAGFGAAQLVVATQRSVLGVALALFATGICYTTYVASSNAIVQLATPGHLQGRVGGLANYVFLATGPVGSLLVGWLAARAGAPATFVLGGVATLVAAVAGAALRPWPMPTGASGRRRARERGRVAAPR